MPAAPPHFPRTGHEAAAAPRALIVSASMGAGHDAAAHELRARLVANGFSVEITDYLDALRWPFGGLLPTLYGLLLHVWPGSYERLYWALERRPVVRRVAFALAGVARPALHRRVRDADPTVIVSTYPLASQALGQLRARGRLGVPLVTYLTDFSVNRSWIHPAVDLHLASSDVTAEQARARGAGAVSVAGPVVPPRFQPAVRTDATRALMRAEWGLEPDARVAVLVAGSWGVGDVEPTVDDVLAGDGAGRSSATRFVPVVLCGRNDAVRRRLAARTGVVALGWTDRMPEILGAADVLIQNAGGMSCMEAFAVGLPVLSYRCLPGHGHHNAATMALAGVAPYARDAAELGAHLRDLARCEPEQNVAVRAASDLFSDEPTRVLVAVATPPGAVLSTSASRRMRRPAGLLLAWTILAVTLLGAGATGVVGATDPDDWQVVAHGTATLRVHVAAVLTRKVASR